MVFVGWFCSVFKLEWNTKSLFRLYEHRTTQVILRSKHRKCSVKQGVLKNFTNFIWKHLFWTLFSEKVTGVPILKNMQTAASGFHDFILRVKFLHKTNFTEAMLYFSSSILGFFKISNVNSKNWMFTSICRLWEKQPIMYNLSSNQFQSSITYLPISSNHL